MANKTKYEHNGFKIQLESFNPTSGVFVICVGFWQSIDGFEKYDEFKDEVLHTKFYRGRSNYFPKQILCWTVGDSSNARRIRKNKAIPFYTDFQLTVKLLNPSVVMYTKRDKVNELGTFRANYPIVKKDIDSWLDYLLTLPCAPTIIKKGA